MDSSTKRDVIINRVSKFGISFENPSFKYFNQIRNVWILNRGDLFITAKQLRKRDVSKNLYEYKKKKRK